MLNHPHQNMSCLKQSSIYKFFPSHFYKPLLSEQNTSTQIGNLAWGLALSSSNSRTAIHISICWHLTNLVKSEYCNACNFPLYFGISSDVPCQQRCRRCAAVVAAAAVASGHGIDSSAVPKLGRSDARSTDSTVSAGRPIHKAKDSLA